MGDNELIHIFSRGSRESSFGRGFSLMQKDRVLKVTTFEDNETSLKIA